MAREWDADIDITPVAASRAIAARFPDAFAGLTPTELRAFGNGWDNVAYLVRESYVFRFVRRAFAQHFFETETRFLGAIADALPLPVPRPLFVGEPCDDAPLGFAGYAVLPGRTGCAAEITDADRARAAPVLGRFLRELHALDPRSADDSPLPSDTIHRHDVRRRAPSCVERLERERGRLPEDLIDAAIDATRGLADAPPWDGRAVTCHGDLYGRHVLFDATGDLGGVIDWGDLHRGDPAVDLGIAYSFVPRHARPALFDAYGHVPEDVRRRARYRAFHYASFLSAYGRETGDAGMSRLGRLALEGGLASDDA